MIINIVLFYSSGLGKLGGVIIEGKKIVEPPFSSATASITTIDLDFPSGMEKIFIKVGFVKVNKDKYPVPVAIEEKEIAEIEEEAEITLPIISGKDSVMTLPLLFSGEVELEEGTSLIAKCYRSKEGVGNK
jgi:hypothetical protein